MADPTKYVPGYSYTGFQGSQPTVPLPAPEVDNDFAEIAASIDEIVDAIKDVRRSDGALKNGIVTADALAATLRDEIVEGAITDAEAAATAAAASAVTAGAAATAAGASQTAAAASAAAALAAQNTILKPKGNWATGTVYVIGDMVFAANPASSYYGSSFYALSGFTSGATFDADFALGRWQPTVLRGASGPGGGDVLASNAGSEYTPVAAAFRGNVGLGALATKSAVATADITDANVTAAKLASNAVTTAKIADANVTTAKIADANVTATKLASNAVETAKIADAAVTTAKITDANVTAAKLASNAVETAKVADEAITLAKLAAAVPTFIRNAARWFPYDDVNPVFYDVAVSGAVAAIEFPFEDGYEYLLIGDNFSGTATSSPGLRVYRDQLAAYTLKSDLYSLADLGAGSYWYLQVHFPDPRITKRAHVMPQAIYGQSGAVITDTFSAVASFNDNAAAVTHATATKIGKAEVSMMSGNIDAGKFLFFRRPGPTL
jgi:hypothetical protein